MRRRLLILTAALVPLVLSCDKCEDETKDYNPELYAAKRRTFYDWDKLQEVKGDTLFLGVGTEFITCSFTSGQDELVLSDVELTTSRTIITETDTIQSDTDLLNDERLTDYIRIYKETDAFFNSPQYIIEIKSTDLNMNGFYAFKFNGLTCDKALIIDSTIVEIK